MLKIKTCFVCLVLYYQNQDDAQGVTVLLIKVYQDFLTVVFRVSDCSIRTIL